MNAATLDALARFPDQLAAHYAAIQTGYSAWTPASWEGVPSESLSAIEQLCHVRDIEIDGYHVRIQRTLTENNPALAALDTDALAGVRHYRTSNAAEVLAAFRAARAKTIAMISALPGEQFDRRDEILARLSEGTRRIAVLALYGLNADEIQYVLDLKPPAFRQRLSALRRTLGGLPEPLRREALALAYSQPRRAGETRLDFGLIRRALLHHLRGGAGVGTHDPDGHLLAIRAP